MTNSKTVFLIYYNCISQDIQSGNYHTILADKSEGWGPITAIKVL